MHSALEINAPVIHCIELIFNRFVVAVTTRVFPVFDHGQSLSRHYDECQEHENNFLKLHLDFNRFLLNKNELIEKEKKKALYTAYLYDFFFFYLSFCDFFR
jgi:hypothetical protein